MTQAAMATICIAVLLHVAGATVAVGAAPAAADWARLPSIPDADGLAGAFAGVCGGRLLVAGGTNFPDKKPWEGGAKAWHDHVYVLDGATGAWKTVGTLRRPLAYGVSVTYRDAVLCVGGSDATRHFADAFRLSWKEGVIVQSPLAPLPGPIANAAGALVGDHLYVIGGQGSPSSTTALATLFELDLATDGAQWRELEPCPGGGRILCVAGAAGTDLCVVSGASLDKDPNGKAVRHYLTDAWRYRPADGWKRLPDLSHPVLGAPSPAPGDAHGFTVLGGDDGSQVGVTPPQGHAGFSKSALRFDVATNSWQPAGELPASRVTTPCVWWKGMWVIPSGEAFPGIRSPEVWTFREPSAAHDP